MKQTEFEVKTRQGSGFYAVEWRPEGPAKAVIALIHGLGEHCQRYAHLADFFTKAGYALLSSDLPGHGKTGGPRGHGSFALIREQIDKLLEEATTRFPGLPRVIYGHSLGGLLVLDYLIERKPDLKAAIVTSPGIEPAVPVPAAKFALAKIMARLAPSFALSNGLEVAGISRDPEVVEKYKADPLVHDRISARMGLDLLEAGPRIVSRIREIELPILLLQGTGDRLVSPAATKRLASAAGKNLSYRPFEGGYHELHNEPEKEALFRLELEWLSSRL
jgi:alpha-beta hydrolase superfamily lysophospholipase